ncbi:alpha/beta hydrolase [Dictyobacter kobayashii]|uniref:Alpha/beta hydrolase n=2 Tax=Dictyobacter kobayashii TaxID=2014872 RepID=A0A402ARL6_9CHLR|nr:alpha/beta hydrolase [Dictyobacter kobayashii]
MGTNLFFLTSLLTLLTTAVVGALQSYRSWRVQELRRIRTNGLVAMTSAGPVEYQISGRGPAVIYAHGTPGGYDQGLAFAQFFDPEKCTMISPSRPGYLGTPQDSGASPEQQADMYAALLDELHIERASVIGFSGGGPSAIQFALRHPERCRNLIMIGAIVQRYCPAESLQLLPAWKRSLLQQVEHLLVSDLFLYCILPIIRILPMGHVMAGMLCSGTIYHLREAGYHNDQHHFARIEQYPLEQITVPTLIVHGTDDEDVPFEDAQLMARTISHVTLVALKKGNHASFFIHARAIIPIIQNFLA